MTERPLLQSVGARDVLLARRDFLRLEAALANEQLLSRKAAAISGVG